MLKIAHMKFAADKKGKKVVTEILMKVSQLCVLEVRQLTSQKERKEFHYPASSYDPTRVSKRNDPSSSK